ncbi:hypothetical protein GCM10010492_69580 [Saccharothrix mutabilis subsp. mutabilis]|uniref:Uncharacterized protein n=1 Tax=Saccharothrix mutabilis subsp. mutabilis TaxID=66855 RepID=A0ABN0UQV2_9PSEU
MEGVKEQRRELVRLCRCAVDRPRWQLGLAVVVSVWSLAWVAGQPFGGPSPVDVARAPLAWAGVPVGWLDAVAAWCAGRTGWLAPVGGLLWAMTTTRRQLPALGGWLAVMAAAQSTGYGAVHRALLALAVFLAVVGLASIPGRRAFVVDRVALIPGDVARAAATAVALSAVVPLIAPGLVVAGLLRPYVTRPPRPRSERKEESSAGIGGALPHQRGPGAEPVPVSSRPRSG